MKKRILLVDDHRLFREGLRALMNAEADLEVVAEAGDGREAVALADSVLPDIVVMDVTMPNLNGIEATRLIKEKHPETRIVALSGHTERRLAVRMLQAGASGYALKERSFAQLREAIDQAAGGHLSCDPRVAESMIADYISSERGGESPIYHLTERELEVLQLLAEGKTTKEIAFELALGVKTIESHRQGIMDKLNIRTIAGLTRFALREGLSPE